MSQLVGEVLAGAKTRLRPHSASPGADGQVLLAAAMGQSRTWILAHAEHAIAGAQQLQFESMLNEVTAGTALPYVLGWWEFYGRKFHIDSHVLIPRPETELMIEAVQERVAGPSNILDLGTGSGCIAVTLALELPHSRVVATDLSWEALQVARKNVSFHGVKRRIQLVNADLLNGLIGRFDALCANLPYVSTDQLEQLDVGRREPRLALDGGSLGIELISPVLERLPIILSRRGHAFFEIDPDQANSALRLAREALPGARLRIIEDLAGRERMLIIEND